MYFLTPAELAAKTAADPTFIENVGFKVGAKVVPGSVRRNPGAQVSTSRSPTESRRTLSPTTAWCPTPSPMPMTSRLSSKDGWAGTASSGPPMCSPSAAPATKPFPRPDDSDDAAGTIRPLGRSPLCYSGPSRSRSRGAGTANRSLSRSVIRSVYAVFGCLAVASIALWKGLIGHDFNIEYVAAYTSRNLPSITSSPPSGPARRAHSCSGRWCCRSSPPPRSCSRPDATRT